MNNFQITLNKSTPIYVNKKEYTINFSYFYIPPFIVKSIQNYESYIEKYCIYYFCIFFFMHYGPCKGPNKILYCQAIYIYIYINLIRLGLWCPRKH